VDQPVVGPVVFGITIAKECPEPLRDDSSRGIIGGQMKDMIGQLWCKRMHTRAMWPIHGRYICPQCLRVHAVAWEGPAQPAEYADPTLRNAGIPLTSTVSYVQ
jgi:hypothetical protein